MSTKKVTYKEICGAIHLHTTYSDGGTTFEEMIDAARQVKLDYIIVTDHMSLGGLYDGYEGFNGDLCVLVGYEHHDFQKKNHYLALGVNKVFNESNHPQNYIDDVKNCGGIGFLAHPAEKRNYFGNLPPYPWTAWDTIGYDGIEIWNQMSDWVENLKSWTSIIKLLYPRRFLGAPPPELLYRWDNINRNRFVSCIGGVDAHTIRVGIGFMSLKVFPIKVELKGIRTHIFIEGNNKEQIEFNRQKLNILNAIKNGHGFISNFRRGDARGTKIYLRYKDGSMFLPGKHQQFHSLPAQITVEIPEKAKIILIADGVAVKHVNGCNAVFDLEKNGLYRIEVYKRSKAWIYSNPFPVGSYPL